MSTRLNELILLSALLPAVMHAAFPVVEVAGQPLAANARRLQQACEFLGQPLRVDKLDAAIAGQDPEAVQQLLDEAALFAVTINPESRVKVTRGAARFRLQQGGYVPVLVKVINQSDTTPRLRIGSPQAGPVYSGPSLPILLRQQQTGLAENENTGQSTERFLDLEISNDSPTSDQLSGLAVEYKLALIYAHEAGPHESTIHFDVGQGTEDLGFRGETHVLFDIRPALPVTLRVRDFDGQPTTGRFEFTDAAGRVHPPQPKRVAPDLFFQKHIYRKDGETVLLPPGRFTMRYGRGPEYRHLSRTITVPSDQPLTIAVKLQRWINPREFGHYSGDHHIHGAGCSHYQFPTQGVEPADMFRQVKGEGLNVGSVLTWGPCFDHQQQFFSPEADALSEPLTMIKYDIEVSGFGSATFGHICLLNLKEQIYPGAVGSKGWPIWTVPTLRWAKQQGAVTGYPHSAGGLQIDPAKATARLFAAYDGDMNGSLSVEELHDALLPDSFANIDRSRDGLLVPEEVKVSHERAADSLPNVAVPEMTGGGAMEIFVTVPLGICDFISAMDTARIPEWNCWYHLLNCGFPLRVSGETDFPCMSGTRVGQGRTYAWLGDAKLTYPAWCEAVAAGRSYVSDGYAHAPVFTVNGQRSGEVIDLPNAGPVDVVTKVAFSSETPIEVEYGGRTPLQGVRLTGDTVNQHPAKAEDLHGGSRVVELIVNGRVRERRTVPADDQIHELRFRTKIERSSWIAIRQFPQLHTNPVTVRIGGKPVRASRASAEWAIQCTEQLWRTRSRRFSKEERPVARATYDQVIAMYRAIAGEAADDTSHGD